MSIDPEPTHCAVGMHALHLIDVVKRFGATRAVDGVSLSVADAEVLALVGPSGCGKSTLLRMIAGLHAVDAGRVELGGRVVDDGDRFVPPERRRVGLVFQEHALFPHLTVAGNVEFGVRDDTAPARAVEMLELVGLAAYADRHPHELSGGERQRVALARALAPRPSLLLLDEPFASLDPNLRGRVRDDVMSIVRASRTPIVFVTHDRQDALAVGDRIAVLDAGRLVQIGSPIDVFHHPASRFVAGFMGEADFVPTLAIRADLHGGVEPGLADDAVVMIRPDDVELVPSEHGDAIVEAAEFRGNDWCYTVRLASGSAVRSLRSHLDQLPVGARVEARLRPGHPPIVMP